VDRVEDGHRGGGRGEDYGLDLCLAPSHAWRGDIKRWLRHPGKVAKKYCVYSIQPPIVNILSDTHS
jgi:hypothetical protein